MKLPTSSLQAPYELPTSSLHVAMPRWPRFSEYVIDDGYLKPAPSASLEWYDPWKEYAAARDRQINGDVAYDHLQNALQGVRPSASIRRSSSLPPRLSRFSYDSGLILEWCRNYGLLGVLLHKTMSMAFRTRSKGGRNVQWSTGRWLSVKQPDDGKTPRKFADLLKDERQHAEPHAMVRRALNEVRREPLTGTWKEFFPRIPPKEVAGHPFSTPETASFWRMYAEPVDEFILAATQVRAAVDGLCRSAKNGPRSDYPMCEEALAALLAPTTVIAPITKRGVVLTWASPSLLGYLGLMLLQDITRVGRVITCPDCGHRKVSKRGIYCSIKCRKNAETRRYRARKKAATTQAPAGVAPKKRKRRKPR